MILIPRTCLRSFQWETAARASRPRALAWLSSLLVLSAGLLSADPVRAAGPGWTANSTIRQLVVTTTGGVNVRLSPDLSACISQSGYGSQHASIYPTHPGINRIKADLLAAYLTGGVVALYLTDNTCTVGEIVLGGW